jgi:hypothetical protein
MGALFQDRLADRIVGHNITLTLVTSSKGLGPEIDYAGEASSMYKRQTRPFIREGAPQKQDRNCQKSNKYLVMSPRWDSNTRLTD